MVRWAASALVLPVVLLGACGGTSTRGGSAGGGPVAGNAGTGAPGGSATGGVAGASASGGGANVSGAATGGIAPTGGTTSTGGGGSIGINPDCLLVPDTGPCEAAIQRYAFDPATGLCRSFVYGGCEGNANNFETAQACELECLGPAVSCDRSCINGICGTSDCALCGGLRDRTGEDCQAPGLTCSWGMCSLFCSCEQQDPTGWAWFCEYSLCPR